MVEEITLALVGLILTGIGIVSASVILFHQSNTKKFHCQFLSNVNEFQNSSSGSDP